MATFPAETKIVVADNNEIHDTNPTWSSQNITGFVSGFGLTNFNIDSPWDMVKTNGVTGTPNITASWDPTNYTMTAFGICNHNLKTAGYSTIILYRSDGAGYTSIGSYTLPDNDADLLLLFNDGSHDYWRAEFVGTTADFEIGYMYWGTYRVMNTNPNDAEMIQRRTNNNLYVNSGGAAVHTIKRRDYRTAELEMTYRRQHRTDADFWRRCANKIYAILPPEYVQKSWDAPEGQDVFYGYVDEVQQAPRTIGSISTSTQTYDTTVIMRGAV